MYRVQMYSSEISMIIAMLEPKSISRYSVDLIHLFGD